MSIETKIQRIEERSGEAYIVMATMTTVGSIICHYGTSSPELVAETTGVVLGGFVGMAIFGVVMVGSAVAQAIWR